MSSTSRNVSCLHRRMRKDLIPSATNRTVVPIPALGRTLLWYKVKTGLWNLVHSFFTNENVKGTSPIRWGVKTGCWIKTYFVSWVVVRVFWGIFDPPPPPNQPASRPPNILAVPLVPLRAAPCFHILSAPARQIRCGRPNDRASSWLFSALCSRHYPCLSMFNCSEKLPSWLSACLKKIKKMWRAECWNLARPECLVLLRSFLRLCDYIFVKLLAQLTKWSPIIRRKQTFQPPSPLLSSCQRLLFTERNNSTFQHNAITAHGFTC